MRPGSRRGRSHVDALRVSREHGRRRDGNGAWEIRDWPIKDWRQRPVGRTILDSAWYAGIYSAPDEHRPQKILKLLLPLTLLFVERGRLLPVDAIQSKARSDSP